ncbi:MAG TPA: PepSY-associated TM helix domain-containing protein [Prolixibacteraceae bacterium]|nr:PepSY-associated TM helix domain-containing protein [Prolixibacteraceae bacterium]
MHLKKSSRSRQAGFLRLTRKIHRTTGMLLFICFFFISATGLLLGWKKHSGGLILPRSYQGSSTNLADWLPVDSLHQNACRFLREKFGADFSTELERIDIRPDKGMVKFVFAANYTGLQLDGATGQLLHLEHRRSDLIENIHDGSILDRYFNTGNGQIKLIYTSVTGIALLLFTGTGFWLWYGPKKLRRTRKQERKLPGHLVDH